ncbi:hypothetical protein ACO0K9_07915 [Undibacterium sp. Ji50W]|uniref:hypothetical protein n=1 Tax=Undibacterium sp. Ji50W TaxID=3413041 RepID=UPI003BF296F3
MAGVKILNYELSPAPATIFGCLLPAPWMGVLTGLLLTFGPQQGLPDRFSPLTLALTHCLVLGMLAPVMIGALFQLMPVVAGQAVTGARKIAPFVAIGSALIAAGLSLGFLRASNAGFVFAGVLALLLYGAITLALLTSACEVAVVDATTRTLRWIVLALLLVVALGISLAGNFAGWWQLDVIYMLDLHVGWGLTGWIATLVVGIASTTVPMFWQTKRPSASWHRALPGVLWLPLLLAFWPALQPFALLLACLVIFLLASISFVTIWCAKRRFDPAWSLWLVCAASYMCAAVLAVFKHIGGSFFSDFILPDFILQTLPWWIGVLVLVGGAVLPVNAMLVKIIPFLVFMHLRRQTPMGQRVPTMQAVLPPQRLRWQAHSVLLAFGLLLLLPLAPGWLAVAAGIAFSLSQAYLGSLLIMCLLRYRHELTAVFLAG